MDSQKRKRTAFTLEQKKEIIAASKKEQNQTQLAKDFTKKWGFEVKRTTVSTILSTKETVTDAIEEGVPAKRKRLTLAHDSRLDDAVLKWFKQARGENLPVSGDLVKVRIELLYLTFVQTSCSGKGYEAG